MNKAWFAGVSALALFAAITASARANCVVRLPVDGVINVVCENVDVLVDATIQSDADAIVIAVGADGNIVVDTNLGTTIFAAGDGIDLQTLDSIIKINNASTIDADVKGIDALAGNNNIDITNSGAITAGDTGILSAILKSVDGDLFKGDGNITVSNTGSIEAGGIGIDSAIDGNGDIIVRNAGTVSANGLCSLSPKKKEVG